MQSTTTEFIEGLFSGDGKKVENSLNELLATYVSIRDFSTNAPKENYYHGFMNGLFVNNASQIQELKSNFESGDGYVDLTVKSDGISEKIAVLELKQTSDENVSRRKIASEAVDQILRKRYADQYIANDNISEVLIYGICFCKKRCSVECKKLK